MPSTSLPPLEHQDWIVDLNIRIYHWGQQFMAEIYSDGSAVRIPIQMTRDDLNAVTQDLYQGLQTAVLERAVGNSIKPDLLAQTGSYLFHKVFGDKSVELLRNLEKQSGGLLSIEITSDDVILPWELMYSGDASTDASFDQFWGMKHFISRVIPQDIRPGAFLPTLLLFDKRPSLGLVTYLGLQSVQCDEVPFFEDLDHTGRIALRRLEALDPAQRSNGIKEWKAFLAHSLHVAHFACEAKYEAMAPHQSHFIVSDEFHLSLQDIEINQFTFVDNPLVILNACTTGTMNPLYTSCFAGVLLKKGARAVVAAECLLPDECASQFIRVLYEYLLKGEQLGRSMLNARQRFLRDRHDPSGLLYAVYGPPTVRLKRRAM